MKKIVIAIASLAAIALVGLMTFRWMTQHSRLTDGTGKTDSAETCISPEAKAVIGSKGLTEVRHCATEPVTVDGQIATLVVVSYGEAQDCQSGCIYSSYTGLVVNGKVTDFGQNPLHHASLYLQKKYGSACMDLSKVAGPVTSTVTKRNGKYWWKLSFNNYSNLAWAEQSDNYPSSYCTANGDLYIYSSGENKPESTDYTNLTVRVLPLTTGQKKYKNNSNTKDSYSNPTPQLKP